MVLADHSWGLGDSENEKCGILHILDTSNPAAIQEISTFELWQSSSSCTGNGNWFIATDLAIRGNLVHSTWLDGGVRTIDISDPTNPVEVAWFLPGSGALSDVALLGSNLVVATTVWGSRMYVLSMP